MKNPEQQRGISWDTIIRTIWGAILPHIADALRSKSSQISERILKEGLRNIIASLVGVLAQIFEKEFKGVHFEILSDIFEQISIGVKAPIEERKKAKPEEVRQRYEWPTLEELEGIANAKEARLKRDLFLTFSSPNVRAKIEQLTDKEIEDLIDVLIQIEKAKREAAKIGIHLDFKSIWEGLRKTFERISSVIGGSLKDAAKFIRENFPKLIEGLNEKANELAEQIESVRESKKWRLI